MSDYRIVNGKKVRVCRYGCGREDLVWSETAGIFGEADGTLHTKERCQQIKESNKPKQKQEFTLEVVQRKLESIGIIINVERLMTQ
ncbi:MAG: hypothetical protein QOA12_05430 [Nitrososphaeraceae archaeon]|nr:hypothetical protein [Nitrososphaeraceae archaeon]